MGSLQWLHFKVQQLHHHIPVPGLRTSGARLSEPYLDTISCKRLDLWRTSDRLHDSLCNVFASHCCFESHVVLPLNVGSMPLVFSRQCVQDPSYWRKRRFNVSCDCFMGIEHEPRDGRKSRCSQTPNGLSIRQTILHWGSSCRYVPGLCQELGES